MKIVNSQDFGSAISYFQGGLILDIDIFFPDGKEELEYDSLRQSLEVILRQRKPSFIAIFSYYLDRGQIINILEDAEMFTTFSNLNAPITQVYKYEIDGFICTTLLELKMFVRFIMSLVSVTLNCCLNIITKSQIIIPFIFQAFDPAEIRKLVIITITKKVMYELSHSNRLTIVKPDTGPIPTTCPEKDCDFTIPTCPRPERNVPMDVGSGGMYSIVRKPTPKKNVSFSNQKLSHRNDGW